MKQAEIKEGMSGKTDVILKEFWRSSARFADLFNAVAFQGKQVLRAEELQEMDTDLSGTIRFPEYAESLVRNRDLVKKAAYGMEFVILGIENQQNIHYAMPLRTMLYDGLGYLKECRELKRSNRPAAKKMSGDEFLSGMRREDRLHPIISIVVYYSEKSWDGPLRLRDMVGEMPEELEEMFADYSMNLVQVRESDGYVFQNEDVRTVFELSREIFRGEFHKINEQYRDKPIQSELVRVIGKITESTELICQSEAEGEVVNMCTALEQLKEEGRLEGREESVRELVREWIKDGYSTEMIAKLLKRPESFVEELKRNVRE